MTTINYADDAGLTMTSNLDAAADKNEDNFLVPSVDDELIAKLGKPTHLKETCCPTGTIEFSGGEQYCCTATEATIQALQTNMSRHPPKILILYGSLRKESVSRKLAIEVGRILANTYGANVRVYDPNGLPLFSQDLNADEIPKAKELRDLVLWSEAMVWISPEIHSNMSSCFKNQIDWIPLSTGAIRPTQGKTVAVMQVEGGSQSFNTVNNLRTLARWMRMVAIPNQVSISTAYKMFEDKDGKLGYEEMKDDCPAKDRVVDVVDELFKYTLLLRDQQPYMVSRYSEAKANKANNNNLKEKKEQDQQKEAEEKMAANFEACKNQVDDASLKSLQNPIILDVRSQKEIELEKGGQALKGSVPVPFNVNGNPQSIHPTTLEEFETKLKDAGVFALLANNNNNNNFDQAFITHCTSGTVDYVGRGAKAAAYLRALGYANSHNGGSANTIRRALG